MNHLLILALLLAFAGGSQAAETPSPPCATGHILIRFKPEARAQLPTAALPGQLSALLRRLNLPSGAELREPPITRLFRQQRQLSSASVREELSLEPFLYLHLPPGLDVAEAVRRLENHPLLEYAEPDFIVRGAATIPDDPNFTDQWYHQNSIQPSASIQTPLAWDITQGSTNVRVAVLDSGLADDLPEFAGRVVPGYNFAETNEVTLDDLGHGTQVAGALAANANNGILGAGVDWHCRILPVKVLGADGNGLVSWGAQGVDYALSNGCKVINYSIGGSEFGRTLQRSITNALAQGVVFVTAAGNEGNDELSFPGYLRPCITVGSTDQLDRRARFSNAGAQLDLVAPGAGIATVGLSGELRYAEGTSFSAPLVAGVCALLAALRPDITQEQASLLLAAGAEDGVGDPGEDVPGFDNYHGWGRLNAFHTLLLATTRVGQARRIDGQIELSWTSPANAGDKRPYQVEYTSSLAGPWIALTNASAFRYEINRTYWTDDGTQTGGLEGARFYRVGLRPF